MKTIYCYSKETGRFVWASALNESDLSPLEPGVYLIPANATEVPPPEAGPDEVPVWTGSSWAVVPLPPEPADKEEPPEPPPEQVRASRLAMLRDVRDRMFARLAGVAMEAQLTGDKPTLDAYLIACQGLRDITKDLPVPLEDMLAEVTRRYSLIVAQVAATSPNLQKAFNGMDL